MIGSNLIESDLRSPGHCYVTKEIAVAAGLRRVISAEGAELVGRTDKGDYSGIAFPYFWTGETQPREYRLRRDHPELELKRGETQERSRHGSPPGRGNLLYFSRVVSPAMLADTTIPIFIVEAEKKTLAAWRLSTEGADRPRFLPVGFDFKEDPAWEDEVNAAELLDDFRNIYKKYVSLPEGAEEASALRDLHTYTLDAHDISPFFANQLPGEEMRQDHHARSEDFTREPTTASIQHQSGRDLSRGGQVPSGPSR